MKKIFLLIILLFSFAVLESCSNRDENPSPEPKYKYEGVYKGNFTSQDGTSIGTFSFYVIRKDDIYSNKFDMNFNYFIVNPSGIKLKESNIDDNGNFTTSVYSFDNFNNQQFRGKLIGKIVGSNMNGTFELSRNANDPNSTSITKGTFSGTKE